MSETVYTPSFFDVLCPILKQHLPHFEEFEFIVRVFNNAWPDLPFHERADQVARSLHPFMPGNFQDAANILLAIAQQLFGAEGRPTPEGEFLRAYVLRYGGAYRDVISKVLEELSSLIERNEFSPAAVA
jgi:hypothetical protein